MDTFFQRYRAMVEELRAHPRALVLRNWVGAPASEEAVQAVEARLGQKVPGPLRAIYRQANGMALEWTAKGLAGYRKVKAPSAAPFDELPGHPAIAGSFNLEPVEDLALDHRDHLWWPDMEAARLEFRQSLRPLDAFSQDRLAAISLRSEIPLAYFGDNHGADFETLKPCPLEEYLEAVLALRGSYAGRVRYFFTDDPHGLPRPTRAPTLEDVLEELEAFQDEARSEKVLREVAKLVERALRAEGKARDKALEAVRALPDWKRSLTLEPLQELAFELIEQDPPRRVVWLSAPAEEPEALAAWRASGRPADTPFVFYLDEDLEKELESIEAEEPGAAPEAADEAEGETARRLLDAQVPFFQAGTYWVFRATPRVVLRSALEGRGIEVREKPTAPEEPAADIEREMFWWGGPNTQRVAELRRILRGA